MIRPPTKLKRLRVRAFCASTEETPEMIERAQFAFEKAVI